MRHISEALAEVVAELQKPLDESITRGLLWDPMDKRRDWTAIVYDFSRSDKPRRKVRMGSIGSAQQQAHRLRVWVSAYGVTARARDGWVILEHEVGR